jgi:homoserine kinase type II
MAQFRTLDADDVQEILRGFGRGGYRSHRPIPVGTINTNVRVELEDGPLFLRVNEGKSADDVRREAAIVAHAAARGVPTPAPLATPNGTPFLRWRKLFVSLFPWFPGRTLTRIEVTTSHAAAVGAALAGLHAASAGFDDRRPGRYEPEEIARRCRQIAKLRRPELADTAATLKAELDLCAAERAAALPTGIIHGDLFIDNVLYADDGKLSALLDFEQASWGRFAYDLAVTTLAFGFGRNDFRRDIVRALIDAYAAARPATPEERAGFGAELRFVACRFAVTRITDVHLKREAGAAPGKNYQRYLDRLASVKHHLGAKDDLFAL